MSWVQVTVLPEMLQPEKGVPVRLEAVEGAMQAPYAEPAKAIRTKITILNGFMKTYCGSAPAVARIDSLR